MFSDNADLFFSSPRTANPRPDGLFSVLYLLRRDIDQCMGIDPNTGRDGGPTILWPGAMAILAGVDLLGKFLAGSDEPGKVGERFCGFLEHCFKMTEPDRETIYQLRNSLLHSFGLYSKSRKATYYFVLTHCGSGPLVSQRPGDRYVVDLRVLYYEFEKAIEVYRSKLDANETERRNNFNEMFGNYGRVSIT